MGGNIREIVRNAFPRANVRFGHAAAVCGMFIALALPDAPFAQTIRSHGISTFGDLSLTVDFEHLPYVNPNAPKGGEMSLSWSSGSFDSIHPYTRKGRSAVLSSIFFESMLENPSHVVGEAYCLLCEYIE